MPDFHPNFIGHGEIIGDMSNPEYNLGFSEELSTLQDNSVDSINDNSTNFFGEMIINVLDFILMVILLPFTTCRRIYENDHLMVMLRVIFEVGLELTMWLVLAGVSIITSAALIFDDLYCGKSTGSEGYRRLVKNRGQCAEEQETRNYQQPSAAIRSDEKINNHSDFSDNKKEKSAVGKTVQYIEPKNDSNDSQWLSYNSYCKNMARLADKDIGKKANFAFEGKEDCVNFSFYKPALRESPRHTPAHGKGWMDR